MNHASIGYWHDTVVCLSVCPPVSVCDEMAKQYILNQKYLNK